ncbi:MAG: hypothetical protein U1F34_03225 [Gammaproteobacteria bacterium]
MLPEFEGKKNGSSSGDVKYHAGLLIELTSHRRRPITLAFNLAPGDHRSGGQFQCARGTGTAISSAMRLLPVLHGDAAFASQVW